MTDPAWRTTTFESLIADGILEIGDGYRAKNSELGGDGLIFLRAGHITDTDICLDGADRFKTELTGRVESKTSMPGDVLVTTKGNSTGRVAFMPEQLPTVVYSPHLSYWRSRQPAKLVPGFLRAWSRGPELKRQIQALAHGTDMAPYLSLKDQRRLRISLPTLPEQRAIAHILGTLDDKIELNRQMNQTLEQIAAALFRSWFVDFDPVRAKAEGRQPEGMDTATAALFPDRLAASEMGEIPEGWRVGKLDDLARVIRDSVTPSSSPEELFSHYSLPAFDSGRIPLVESGASIKSNKYLVTDDVVLISKLNPHIPRVWFPFDVNGHRRLASTEFVVAEPLEPAHRPYLYALASSDTFLQRLQGMVTGTTGSHQRVPPAAILSMPLSVPPDSAIAAYSDLVRPIYSRVQANLAESGTLSQLRDTLLPRLLSGELRVPLDRLDEEAIAMPAVREPALVQSRF